MIKETAKIAKTFLTTGVLGVQLIGKTEQQRNAIKHKWANMVVKSFGFNLKVKGNPPNTDSYILVGNHISYLDIPVIMAVLPEATFIAKSDMRKWPIIGPGAALAGTIFVDRTPGSDRSNVRTVVSEYLKGHNRKVAVFPSGTTRLHEERVWKKGIFEIAKVSRTPIQMFRLDYEPLRESAYIDDDTLILQMAKVLKKKNKTVTLTWLDQVKEVDDPAKSAEMLRAKVTAQASALNL